MCYVRNEVRQVVEETLNKMTSHKQVFTGWEVELKSGVEVDGHEISTFVRELFNSHHDIFKGYACYPIPGGPLLFFPIIKTSQKVQTKIKEIDKAITIS